MKAHETHRVPLRLCPSCGHVHDALTGLPDREVRAPRPGDWSLCFECTQPLVMGDDLLLRLPSAADMMTLDARDLIAMNRERLGIALFNAANPRMDKGGTRA